MTTILKNVLSFSGLGIGVPSVQPHLLNVNGIGVIPRNIYSQGSGFTITADATNVTVTRGATGAAAVVIEVEFWHTIEDCEPYPGIAASLFPVVIQGNPVVGGGGAIGINAISGGTTLASSGTVSFANANGVSFGVNGQTITGSVAAGGGVALSAGSVQASTGTVSFANGNGVSFGMNGQTITGSVAAGGVAIGGISAGTTLATSGTVSFANANGVSFGVNGQTVTGSVAAGVGAITVSQLEFNRPNTTNGLADSIMTMHYTVLGAALSATQVAVLHDLPSLLAQGAGTQSVTIGIGVYTMSGSTASLASSASALITYASSNDSNFSQPRWRTMAGNFNLTAGEYLIGHYAHASTTFAQTAYGVQRFFPAQAPAPGGFGDGIVTSGGNFTLAPNSVHFSNILQTALSGATGFPGSYLMPTMHFAGSF